MPAMAYQLALYTKPPLLEEAVTIDLTFHHQTHQPLLHPDLTPLFTFSVAQ